MCGAVGVCGEIVDYLWCRLLSRFVSRGTSDIVFAGRGLCPISALALSSTLRSYGIGLLCNADAE